MPTVHFILNDKDLSEFDALCDEIIGKRFAEVENKPAVNNLKTYSVLKKLVDRKCEYLLFKDCSFDPNVIIDTKEAKSFIDGIKDAFGEKIKDIFLHINDLKKDITATQFSAFVTKYDDQKITSGATFYNFGRTYISNKTFFDSGYSLFGDNIAHEAINCFMTDKGERYFYLCDDGKIGTYGTVAEIKNNNKKKRQSSSCFPDNYFDWDKAELINYSKYDSGEDKKTSNYAILQRVTKIEPCEEAFKSERNKDDYKNINYGGVNICDIFSSNKFTRKDPKTGKEKKVDENYPLITFKPNGIVLVPKNEIPVFQPKGDQRFNNFSSSSLKQFSIFEGTALYNAFYEIINDKKIQWVEENPKTVEEYISGEKGDYKNDTEEAFLLKIIDRDKRETFFSRIIEFLFANSKEILSNFIKSVYNSTIAVKEVSGVFNEDKNIDVKFTFFDMNGTEHLVVIENKLYAEFSDNQKKSLAEIFGVSNKNEAKNEALENRIDIVEKAFDDYKVGKEKESNQLTKYYKIANVNYLNMYPDTTPGQNSSKLHFLILAPEFRVKELKAKKDAYYYGEFYDVISYKLFKEVLDSTIEAGACDNDDPLKGIVVQFSRAIRQYSSDNCTYYQRKMMSRFAKAVEQKCKKAVSP